MVMRDIGSFHCPGAAEGNKHGQGAMETACIPKYPYFNCSIVSIQYIYTRLFALVGWLVGCV